MYGTARFFYLLKFYNSLKALFDNQKALTQVGVHSDETVNFIKKKV